MIILKQFCFLFRCIPTLILHHHSYTDNNSKLEGISTFSSVLGVDGLWPERPERAARWVVFLVLLILTSSSSLERRSSVLGYIMNHSQKTNLLNHCSFSSITNNTHTGSTWILESTGRAHPMICGFIDCGNNSRHSRCWIWRGTSEWLHLFDFTLTSNSQLFRIKLSRSTNERKK